MPLPYRPARTRATAGLACVPFVAGLMLTAPATDLAAQNLAATLTVTVVDPSGAPIEGALISLTSVEESARILSEVRQTGAGPARIVLQPGIYDLRVEAAGFRAATSRLQVRQGNLRRIVRLDLASLASAVTVERTPQDIALDPRGFSTVLTREQIDMLPDDPEAMLRVLRDLAPPGAQIRIDGFSGAAMPSKAQILSIRIPRLDSYAAQDHGGLSASSYIDIVTRPGAGVLSGSLDGIFRHHALDARNPLSSHRPTTVWQAGAFAADGPLIRDRGSFNLSIRAGRQEEMATVRAALPTGLLMDSVPRSTHTLAVHARTSFRWGTDQTVRIGMTHARQSLDQVGVGDFELRERGARYSSSDSRLQVAAGGAWGRTRLWEVRSQLRWTDTATRPSTEAVAIRVLDAFSAGGAQIADDTATAAMDISTDVDYVRGRHTWKVGTALELTSAHIARRSNYLGTYTFASLADFAASRPAIFTQRIGVADARYSNVQIGAFVQDDMRIARSLLLNYGMRFEQQSLVPDSFAILPRVGLSWSPSRGGRTVVRAGAGRFSDWLPTGTFEQSLIVNGTTQRDLLVISPSYPGAESAALAHPPAERYLLQPGLRLPTALGFSVGVERQATPTLRLIATYSRRTGSGLLYAINLNGRSAIGQRPDPTAGNVIQASNGAGFESETLMAQVVRLAPRSRLEFAAAYAHTRQRTNTSGAFNLPAGELQQEWGATTPTHAATATLTVRPVKSATLALTPRWRSGAPYTVTTGRDENGDGFFTDRPPDIGRNSGRTPPLWDLGVRIGYTIAFGPPSETSAGQRYRVELFASAQNATNRTSFVAVSGVQTSPFYGRATAAAPARRTEAGFRIAF